MKKIVIALIFCGAIVMIGFNSCTKKASESVQLNGELNLPDDSYDYFEPTAIEEKLTTAGRVLFYDKHLSLNNSISCASCHKQQYAFGDNRATSLGFGNKETSRQSIAIHNIVPPSNWVLNFSATLFWDGRSSDLRDMVLEPTTNHIEMGLRSQEELVKKIKELGYYDELFLEADEEINITSVKQALALFIASLEVKNTRFDKEQDGLLEFSALEKYGESIFNGKYNCGSCHRMEMQYYATNRNQFVNIGLDANAKDIGRMAITNNTSDKGSFVIPGLRNVQFSAPYMHDGRFNTLEEVFEHYSHGINKTPNLDWRLQDDKGEPLEMNISEYDKKALIAFLSTLTDYDLLTHDRFSNPFKNQ